MKIVNNHKSAIGLPRLNIEVPAGGSVSLNKEQAAKIDGHNVIKAWQKAGVLTITNDDGSAHPDVNRDDDETVDYSKMKVDDLKELLAERGIDFESDDKKAVLIGRLEAADAE